MRDENLLQVETISSVTDFLDGKLQRLSGGVNRFNVFNRWWSLNDELVIDYELLQVK